MAYLRIKMGQLDKSRSSFKEILNMKNTALVRDAALLRFRLSTDLLWKTIQIYLREIEGIECVSPKSCFREARIVFDLGDEEVETCLKMIDDRNLSVHAYSEKMSEAIYNRLPKYFRITERVAEDIEANLNQK